MASVLPEARICPLCSQDNKCEVESGAESCWCMREKFPEELMEQVPPDQNGKVCICEKCLKSFVMET
ncbi:hypothetical protein SY83_03755 [Paenibacillus swuensis]|uniref:Cysteine-rich CWC n=1 Tax=Paenibacillus swuensis TaxID=1178515 RepID=A0A172TNW8_9BACL|nr:hypothetical protein SY83_03755 [Paenibacillus swuensis]